MAVLVETSLGDLVIELYSDKCPLASKNFLKLCKSKYYNNSLFHTIQRDYLTEIKTKDNQSFYEQQNSQQKYFNDEIHPDIKYNKMGLVGTSNLGPNRNQADFFITLTDRPLTNLDGKHTIFGFIDPEEGRDVLLKLNEQYVSENDQRPYYNIRIKKTMILEDPFDDPEGFEEPQSPEEIKEDDNGRLEYHEKEHLIDESGKTEEELLKETKKHRAKTNAIVLELLNDIADADAAPPENVLFVCKLNQATQESDLEMIFSRFGPIKKCEVVRDWKTGQSLQYAFIEFETEAACKEAFFKMENVLIDERRIHVNFCQSVEKLWTKYKSKNNKQKQQMQQQGNDEEDKQVQIVLKDQYKQRRSKHNYVFSKDEIQDKYYDDNKYKRRSRSRSNDRKEKRDRSRDRRDDSRDRKDRKRDRRDDSRDRKERKRERSRDRRSSRSRDRREKRDRSRDRKDKRNRSRDRR